MNVARVIVGLILAGMMNPVHAAEPPEPVVLKGHTKSVTAVAWAADGKAVATAGDDRTIRMWDPATGRQTASLPEIAREGYGGPVVAFNADLKIIAVNYWGEIAIRTAADGKTLLKIDPILDRDKPSTFRPDVYAMAFSPDGKRLGTAGSVAGQGLPGGIVIIWDAETGKIIHQSEKLATAASSLAWSRDGKRFAAGTNGVGGELPAPGEVLVWDAVTGKALHRFKVKPEVEYGEWASAGDVAFSSPYGTRVAAPVTAGSRAAPAGLLLDDTGASVRMWDLETGKSTQPVKGLKASVGRIVFSPDGKSLATAGRDKLTRVWDVETGKELAALPSPDQVTAVAFSPDGKSFAAGSKDGSVRIWAAPAVEAPWNKVAPFTVPPESLSKELGSYRSPLQFDDGTRVTTADQWPRRRAEILSYWQKELGPWPDVISQPRVEVLKEEQRDGLTWRRVRVEIAPQQTGEGWVLRPAGDGPFPAVLVVYYEPETSVGRAKKEETAQPVRDFALQLAKRGFVTLSVGTPGGDAYRPELGKAACQPLSFHAYVAANCWQVLANMPEVDSSRIGVTGHSYGGKWSLFAAALWDKFAAVAVSDPGIVFDEARPSVNYWEPWYLGLDPQVRRPKAGVPSADNPRTGAYKRLVEAGHDLHEIHALIAPRPFLVSGGSEDPVARWAVLNHLRAINELLGKPSVVAMTNRPAHAPTPDSNEVLYAFFEHFLGKRP